MKPSLRRLRERFSDSKEEKVQDYLQSTGKLDEVKQLTVEGMKGKSEDWMEKKRADLNKAWKKVKHETRSMFCAKGKHERCTFDPDCSCSCHVK